MLTVAIYVAPVRSSGLPLWQVVPLTVLGVGIAFGLIWAFTWLLKLPAEVRLRRRVREVEAAAGAASPYAPETVREACAHLFAEVQAAWDAGDRERLSRISDPDLMADWIKRIDRYAALGGRYRGSVRSGPRVDYVSLLADRGQVRLRVRAKVRRWLELPDGSRRSLPGDRSHRVTLEEYWTLARSDGEWILFSTRRTGFEKEYTTEPIVANIATAAGLT